MRTVWIGFDNKEIKSFGSEKEELGETFFKIKRDDKYVAFIPLSKITWISIDE